MANLIQGKLIKIQERATPFLQKLLKFNIEARKEFECAFESDDSYLLMANEKISNIITILEELKKKLLHKI